MIKNFDEFINENITNQKYLSDEDINKQYEGFEISDFTIKPRRRWYYQSGIDNPDTEYTWDISFNIIFPNAEHEDFDESLWENAFVYDEHGKRIGFDNWYPEDVAEKLIQMIRDEINKHWSDLERLKSDENHNMNSSIKESINYEQLNESFTNQELKDAIKEHGGLSKTYKEIDARTLYTEQSNSFDLVDCKYCGYISPEIVEIINKEFKCNTRVWHYIYTNILLTNDGGAIIIDNGDDNLGDEHRKWIKKMKIRNNNWKEDWLNNNTGKSTRLWRKGFSQEDVDDHKIPDRFNTSMRRSKHINRK